MTDPQAPKDASTPEVAVPPPVPDKSSSPPDGGPVCDQCGYAGDPGAKFCRACGHKLAAEPGTDLVHVGPADPPWAKNSPGSKFSMPHLTWDRKQKRRAILAGVVLVAILAVGGTFQVVQDSWYSAEDTVAQYLDEVLVPGAGYEPPESWKVGAFTAGEKYGVDQTKRGDGSKGSVAFTYVIDGQTYTGAVDVERATEGWFRDWTASPLCMSAQVETTGHIPVVKVGDHNGLTLQDGEFSNSGHNKLLPGSYEVTIPESPLLDMEPAKITIADADCGSWGKDGTWHPGTRLDITGQELTIKDDVLAWTEEQLHARLDECAEVKDRDPGCGLIAEGIVQIDTDEPMTWDIESYPEIELRLADEPTTEEAPVEVITTKPGEAIFSYTKPGIDKGTEKTVTITYDAWGGVGLTNGDLEWKALSKWY